MDLSAVEAFVLAAEAKSFTEAARKLGITASGVSRAVTRLESQVGVMLLHRTTRTVGLTAEGTIFFERCRQILADLKEAEGILAKTTMTPSGRLRITMSVAFGRAMIIPALGRLSRRYPELFVETNLSDATVDIVNEGFDAAIRIGDLTPSGLIARRIGETRWVACASPDYLIRKGTPTTPDDLRQHECIAYLLEKSGRYLDWQFSRADRQWLIRSGNLARLSVDHCDALVDLALAGAGIVYIHDYVVEKYFESGQLVPLLEGFDTPRREIHVVYPPLRQLSPKVRAFIDMAIEAVSGDDRGGKKAEIALAAALAGKPNC